jgi:hypothetical protein
MSAQWITFEIKARRTKVGGQILVLRPTSENLDAEWDIDEVHGGEFVRLE